MEDAGCRAGRCPESAVSVHCVLVVFSLLCGPTPDFPVDFVDDADEGVSQPFVSLLSLTLNWLDDDPAGFFGKPEPPLPGTPGGA